MPPGPERIAAKTEEFRLAYSGGGLSHLMGEPMGEFTVFGTATGRLPRRPRPEPAGEE